MYPVHLKKFRGLSLVIILFLVSLVSAVSIGTYYIYITRFNNNSSKISPSKSQTTTPTPTMMDLSNQEIPSADDSLTNANVIENPSDRVNLHEGSLLNNGKLQTFSIQPVYRFLLVKISEIDPEVFETTWKFEVDGQKKMFKTLTTRCVVTRDAMEIIFGELNTKEGEEDNPWFSGLEQQMGADVFSGKDETKCRKVWGGLQYSSDLVNDIYNFFVNGVINERWIINDGIADLTDRIVLR